MDFLWQGVPQLRFLSLRLLQLPAIHSTITLVGRVGATAPRRAHLGASRSTPSPPTHYLGASAGWAAGPAMNPCTAEGSIGLAFLPGASKETLTISRELPLLSRNGKVALFFSPLLWAPGTVCRCNNTGRSSAGMAISERIPQEMGNRCFLL